MLKQKYDRIRMIFAVFMLVLFAVSLGTTAASACASKHTVKYVTTNVGNCNDNIGHNNVVYNGHIIIKFIIGSFGDDGGCSESYMRGINIDSTAVGNG